MIEDPHKHWLYRRSSLPWLWGILIVILVISVIPEFFVHHHAYFEDQGTAIEASFGFHAWYGFITCAAMVVAAKILGVFLKRKDTYYDD